eukprot:CAMPEP_0197609704 /NCGR_PEP_ID=MMETSP1326-20131121/51720_1 /TAXON_ID=1155430 /ORGANISM="Genus nov. species nov., Strain RCC2288" /LENGTH=58 /DNA_ID=CAMNT_0043178113 /DNA_START=148 /DNA_END=324 /DNA_ORIENTATION=+
MLAPAGQAPVQPTDTADTALARALERAPLVVVTPLRQHITSYGALPGVSGDSRLVQIT